MYIQIQNNNSLDGWDGSSNFMPLSIRFSAMEKFSIPGLASTTCIWSAWVTNSIFIKNRLATSWSCILVDWWKRIHQCNMTKDWDSHFSANQSLCKNCKSPFLNKQHINMCKIFCSWAVCLYFYFTNNVHRASRCLYWNEW